MFKSLILFGVVFFASTGNAGKETLIKAYLQELDKVNIYQSQGITSGFTFEKDSRDQEVLRIHLKQHQKEIGYIELQINDYVGASQLAQEIQYYAENLKQLNKANTDMETALGEFKNNIKDDNVSYVQWVKISYQFKGKGLSYPLLCHALKILNKVYNKDIVFFIDHSNKPGYYAKIGFKPLSYRDFYFGSIDSILKGQKCQGS